MSRSCHNHVLAICCALALGACGDDRYILIEVGKAGGWVIDGGSIDARAPGVIITYPEPIELRFGIESVVDHQPSKLQTSEPTIRTFETFSGQPCEVSVEPTCQGTTCETELSLLGDGLCMIRIRATTDGEPHGACWYRATFMSTDLPSDIADRVASDHQRCLDSFDADSL